MYVSRKYVESTYSYHAPFRPIEFLLFLLVLALYKVGTVMQGCRYGEVRITVVVLGRYRRNVGIEEVESTYLCRSLVSSTGRL